MFYYSNLSQDFYYNNWHKVVKLVNLKLKIINFINSLE